MAKADRLIIFFIPPTKLVNGGIMSIFSICRISREFKKLHGAEVLIATYPGDKSYHKNDLFENNETIYSFDEIIERGVPEFLQLHIPEYASHEIFQKLEAYSDYIQAVPDLRINMLTQNILLLQQPTEVADWRALTSHITQTAAHDRYATQQLADTYDMPVHLLSTFIDPSQFKHVAYENKENLIVLSPDETPQRQAIADALVANLPDYKIITIRNMTYEEYKRTIATAKFTITFGEGPDGYFVGTSFSGGIPFAAYNEDFFPDDSYAKLDNVYSSYDEMLKNIVKDIKQLDSQVAFDKLGGINFKKLASLYSFSSYKENIRRFYAGKFSFTPRAGSTDTLLAKVVQNKQTILKANDERIMSLDNLNTENQQVINRLGHEIAVRDKIISEMRDSPSWKVTKPLRGVKKLRRKS